jgi:hypothetical protein
MTIKNIEQICEQLKKIPRDVFKMYPYRDIHPVDLIKNADYNGLLYIAGLVNPKTKVINFPNLSKFNESRIFIFNPTDPSDKGITIKVGSDDFFDKCYADLIIRSDCGCYYESGFSNNHDWGIDLLPYSHVLHLIRSDECGSGFCNLKLYKNSSKTIKDLFNGDIETRANETKKSLLDSSEIKIPKALIGRFHILPMLRGEM